MIYKSMLITGEMGTVEPGRMYDPEHAAEEGDQNVRERFVGLPDSRRVKGKSE